MSILVTTYSFPNEEIPTARYAIGSDFLWDLVRTSTGQIVPVANRTIYFCIEVYEQYDVKAQVERVEHDTNSTTRTTQLSSSVHNILELLTVNAGATDNAGIYTSVDFVTYEGLTFNLSSTYDEKRYSGVEYSHNDEAIEGSIFILLSISLPACFFFFDLFFHLLLRL